MDPNPKGLVVKGVSNIMLTLRLCCAVLIKKKCLKFFIKVFPKHFLTEEFMEELKLLRAALSSGW